MIAARREIGEIHAGHSPWRHEAALHVREQALDLLVDDRASIERAAVGPSHDHLNWRFRSRRHEIANPVLPPVVQERTTGGRDDVLGWRVRGDRGGAPVETDAAREPIELDDQIGGVVHAANDGAGMVNDWLTTMRSRNSPSDVPCPWPDMTDGVLHDGSHGDSEPSCARVDPS